MFSSLPIRNAIVGIALAAIPTFVHAEICWPWQKPAHHAIANAPVQVKPYNPVHHYRVLLYTPMNPIKWVCTKYVPLYQTFTTIDIIAPPQRIPFGDYPDTPKHNDYLDDTPSQMPVINMPPELGGIFGKPPSPPIGPPIIPPIEVPPTTPITPVPLVGPPWTPPTITPPTGPIPEMGVWCYLIIGFGSIGSLARYKRKRLYG